MFNTIKVNNTDTNYTHSIFDISDYNSGATYNDLSTALAAIPESKLHVGMTVRYVLTDDNEYVQFRCKTQSFSANPKDWYFEGGETLVDNNEFISVWTDAKDRIIIAIEQNGNIKFGAGVPQQVIDYVNEKISEFSPGEYESIVTFLGELIEGDKTLAELLYEKVDKEDGKSLIDEEVADGIHYIENSEFVKAWCDNEDKVLFALRADGDVFFGYGVPSQIKNYVDNNTLGLNDNVAAIQAFLEGFTDTTLLQYLNDTYGEYEESPEYIKAEVDSAGVLISSRRKDGTLVENVGIETPKIQLAEEGVIDLVKDLEAHGLAGGIGDWSSLSELHIAEPYCARVNFVGIEDIPQEKGVDLKGYMQFWDMNGNYFKKEVIMNAQGSSSMSHPKKNISIDICNNNGWDDDDTFKLQIGDWVPQDSFHLKAFYMDAFRGLCPIAYKWYNQIVKTRGELNDYFWKKELIDFGSITPTSNGSSTAEDTEDQFNTGAKCFPDGFPCIVYLNGEFYGIYSWQLKKHRDNYHMNKNNPKHIHLDGMIGDDLLFNGNINWGGIEVRNPKNIVYAGYDTYDSSTVYGKSVKVIKDLHVYISLRQDNNHPVTDTSWWEDLGSLGWKYDADLIEAEIAGNPDGSDTYDTYTSGTSYAIGKIVKHVASFDSKEHLFINTIDGNTSEPIIVYDESKDETYNKDNNPDFKNKTKCGWINCTNTVKVKKYIQNMVSMKSAVTSAYSTYIASSKTAEDVAIFKAVFDTYFDVDNVIDYTIFSDVSNNYDGFYKNWQWLTYNGTKWYISVYDCDGVFGGFNALDDTILAPLTNHLTIEQQSVAWLGANWLFDIMFDVYVTDLEVRYKELRDKGIIDSNHIVDMMINWLDRIGNKQTFELEWKKWPFVKNDSIHRMYKWLIESISNMDSLYRYNQN